MKRWSDMKCKFLPTLLRKMVYWYISKQNEIVPTKGTWLWLPWLMYWANYSQLKAVSSCLYSLVHPDVSIINMIVMWHEWSSEEVLVTVDRRQESTCARYSVLAAISCHYNIITSPATSSPTIKIDPELIGEGSDTQLSTLLLHTSHLCYFPQFLIISLEILWHKSWYSCYTWQMH